MWEIELAPGSTSPRHHMDREEVFLGVGGHAIAEIDGTEHELGAGDCLILPAGTDFTLHVPGTQPLPRPGLRARRRPGDHGCHGATFLPPWAA